MKLSLRKFVQPIGRGEMWFLDRSDRPGTSLLLDVEDPKQLMVLGFLGLIDCRLGEWIIEEREVDFAPLVESVDTADSGSAAERHEGSSPSWGICCK